MLDVALVGTGGMMPLPNRYLTALLCRLNGSLLLIDCGEGTQVTLKLLGWGFKCIDTICFTHFHADHISGLPGLLLTIGNAGRTEPLLLIGPAGLAAVAKSLCVIAPELPFEVRVTELDSRKPGAVSASGYNISTFPMRHGTACLGYTLNIGRLGRFDAERAVAQGIPKQIWSKLQKEGFAMYEGTAYTGDMVMGPPRKGLKVAYCTDSRPVPGLADFVRGADLFVCEGIYGEDDKLEKAKEHRHMIFSEAAQIARDGQVSELWLTHFSPALTEPKAFVKNASRIFPRTKTGYDRMNTTLRFEEE